MRISSKSKIAFHILLDIAAHTADGRAISIPIICRRHQLSHSYLESIFGQLRLAGFIRSHRGPGGGYSLEKNPQDISLLDVVNLMNGQEKVREDLSAPLWSSLDVHMADQMKRVTLKAVLERAPVSLESSTKGVSLERRSENLNNQTSPKSQNKTKRMKPRLGPNSVFAFGRYLQSN